MGDEGVVEDVELAGHEGIGDVGRRPRAGGGDRREGVGVGEDGAALEVDGGLGLVRLR